MCLAVRALKTDRNGTAGREDSRPPLVSPEASLTLIFPINELFIIMICTLNQLLYRRRDERNLRTASVVAAAAVAAAAVAAAAVAPWKFATSASLELGTLLSMLSMRRASTCRKEAA